MAQMDIVQADTIHAVIVAGGQGSRVGYRQKALLPYHGKPIIETIIAKLTPQVQHISINANAELQRYQVYCSQVFADAYQGFLGPLAGMHAAWQHLDSEWAVFLPCDNPNLPSDFVERLLQVQQQTMKPIVVVNDGTRMQPLYLLMHRSMAESLQQAIEIRHLSVNRWVRENDYVEANFADCCPQAFQNLNTLQGFDIAEEREFVESK